MEGGAQEILFGQFSNPYFPVNFEFLLAKKGFEDLDLKPYKFGDLTISPFPLNHPGDAYGYRIESDGAVIVYATDLEHGDEELDKVVREFSQNTDLLIFDSQYTPDDYESHRGWGHSTWQEACKVANEAQVNQLVLFHHQPAYDDAKLDRITEEASPGIRKCELCPGRRLGHPVAGFGILGGGSRPEAPPTFLFYLDLSA